MMNDVFISYSSEDKHTADAVCSTLENAGIRCWIAPRDILPGSDWPTSIAEAIDESKIMVLIFSHSSNDSVHVNNEILRAVDNKLMVVPFKIDESKPNKGMELILSKMHWLDAIDGDMQEKISRLKDIILSILPHNVKEELSDTADTNTENKTTPGTNNPGNINNAGTGYTDTGNNKDRVNVPRKVRDNPFLAYFDLWKRCFDYKGRSSRFEYWSAFVVNIVATILVLIFNVYAHPESPVIIQLYIACAGIAFISLGVRRLHDSNHSGHLMWLLLSGYGAIVPFVFFFFRSVDNGNRFGN